MTSFERREEVEGVIVQRVTIVLVVVVVERPGVVSEAAVGRLMLRLAVVAAAL